MNFPTCSYQLIIGFHSIMLLSMLLQFRGWKESLETTWKEKIKEEEWHIDIIRSYAAKTALQQFSDASDEDWEHMLKINFIGEAGADLGGLRLELLTIFFSSCELFDGEFFHISDDNLSKKLFLVLGKATAYAILSGHPGPRRLHQTLVHYILHEKEPDVSSVVCDAAAMHVVNQVLPDPCQCHISLPGGIFFPYQNAIKTIWLSCGSCFLCTLAKTKQQIWSQK